MNYILRQDTDSEHDNENEIMKDNWSNSRIKTSVEFNEKPALLFSENQSVKFKESKKELSKKEIDTDISSSGKTNGESDNKSNTLATPRDNRRNRLYSRNKFRFTKF